jgi:DNA repair protein RecN (Recombination protein N)
VEVFISCSVFVKTSYVRLKFALYPSNLQGIPKMLRLLRIRNLALIRELEIEFGAGLNLLTGETGSGKSILVDALGLLLGARSSQEMIRSDCDTATIEGVFEIESSAPLLQMLAEAGSDTEDGSLIIRREISSSGRNRIFINNQLAPLSSLKQLADKLADIHGQQDQRSLLDLPTHLERMDFFGDNAHLLKEVRETFQKLRDTAKQLEVLETDEKGRLQRLDMLQFQIDEIRRVDPKPEEKETLEEERNILANHEKILSLATETYGILYESQSSVLSQINRVERILEELGQFDKSWEPYREALQESRYKFEDLAYSARAYASRSDFSPERLEQVSQRLYALNKLTKKYGSSLGEVVEYLDRCTKELDTLLAYADNSARIMKRFEEEWKTYLEKAEKLSQKRRRDAKTLETEIRKEFLALAMEQMELHVKFHQKDENPAKGRLPAFCGLDGIDHVEFLIAPNKGEEIMPLAKIASGGELSRLMLAIRSLCGSEDSGKTLVFDEVDAGIGGRVAEAVGRRLKAISENHQVLCVTHLPQIAAFASRHFSVRKEVVGARTETVVQCLDSSERITELSRMLGGENITETTLRHTMEMLEYSTSVGRKK